MRTSFIQPPLSKLSLPKAYKMTLCIYWFSKVKNSKKQTNVEYSATEKNPDEELIRYMTEEMTRMEMCLLTEHKNNKSKKHLPQISLRCHPNMHNSETHFCNYSKST